MRMVRFLCPLTDEGTCGKLCSRDYWVVVLDLEEIRTELAGRGRFVSQRFLWSDAAPLGRRVRERPRP